MVPLGRKTKKKKTARLQIWEVFLTQNNRLGTYINRSTNNFKATLKTFYHYLSDLV